MLNRPLLSYEPSATPMQPCSAPSSLTATPIGNATSLNVPFFWFWYRKFWPRIVGDEQIRPAVLVVVEPAHAEAEEAARIGDARLFGDSVNRRPPSFLKEKVGFAGQSSRAALDRRCRGTRHVLSRPNCGSFCRSILHVAADEEVEVAVAIVIGEPASRGPAAGSAARRAPSHR